jgi:hypothetical protein
MLADFITKLMNMVLEFLNTLFGTTFVFNLI